MKRVDKYLENMDTIRDSIDVKVDESLKKIDVDKLLTINHNEKKIYLKMFMMQFIVKNNSIFKEAQKEGRAFANAIKS